MYGASQFLIDNEVSTQASFCHRGKACLADADHEMCTITQCVNGQVHFVCGTKGSCCDYRISFGSGYICSCPVRIEIYRQHRV